LNLWRDKKVSPSSFGFILWDWFCGLWYYNFYGV